jgi:hypothetical protein
MKLKRLNTLHLNLLYLLHYNLSIRIRKIIYLVNVKHVVTKWLLAVLNVPPATLEFKPRVNQKSSAFGFIIFGAPHFRNPYLAKVTNQLGSTLLVTHANRDTFRYH